MNNGAERALSPAEQNQLLFMKWLATNHPTIYNAYVQAGTVNAEFSGIFDAIGTFFSGASNFVTGIINKAPEVIQQYGATKSQIDLIRANLNRVQAGQPPINADGSVVQPNQMIQMLPTTPQGTPAPVTAGFQMPMWGWVALGGVALFLLTQRR